MGQPHKHRDLIRAWADGAEIQSLHIVGDDWVDTKNPAWGSNDFKFRIKPEPKPDVVKYGLVMFNETATPFTKDYQRNDNIKLTWDGETGDLIKAEVLK